MHRRTLMFRRGTMLTALTAFVLGPGGATMPAAGAAAGRWRRRGTPLDDSAQHRWAEHRDPGFTAFEPFQAASRRPSHLRPILGLVLAALAVSAAVAFVLRRRVDAEPPG